MIDVRRAGVQRDCGDLAQRNVSVDPAGGLKPDLDGADPIQTVAVLGRDTGDQGELALTFEHGGRLRPAQGRLDDTVDVAGVEAIPRRFLTIHRDIQVRLAENAEDPEIGDPLDPGHDGQDLCGDLLQCRQLAADDLDRVGALDARQLLFDVVLDVLREVEPDPGEFFEEYLLQLLDQPLLRHAPGPLIRRLQRREELRVVEARRIAAVVWPTVLRDDGDDFRS